MIREIFISNIAIIEQTHFKLTEGVNVMTGETGAGKSILIDSIQLILGGRADRNLVGKYSDKAVVEALVEVNPDVKTLLNKEFGIDIKDNQLIITREIFDSGRSVARLDNRIVNLSVIQSIMSRTVDIYTQNSTGLLLNKSNYIDLINQLAGQNAYLLLNEIGLSLDSISNLKKDIKELNLSESEIIRETELLSYQIEEIELADFENTDYDEIGEEYKKLSNVTDIRACLEKSKSAFQGSVYSKNVLDILSDAIVQLQNAEEFDQAILDLRKAFDSVYYQLEDLRRELFSLTDTIVPNEEKLMELSDSIRNYEALRRKYGSNKDEVLTYLDEIKEKYNRLMEADKISRNLKFQLQAEEDKLAEIATKLSLIRGKVAEDFEKSIKNELKKLNFANTEFKVSLKEKSIDRGGGDDIDFLVSFNIGQDLKSLSETASGGELSRFMLALKIITAENDSISSLVFDEIDAGISGVTAEIVGGVIKRLAEKYQILLVTHLPQIAVIGNNHLLIEKYTEDETTKSRLRRICGDEVVMEVSRLIGGSNITDTVIRSAREQIDKHKNEVD